MLPPTFIIYYKILHDIG